MSSGVLHNQKKQVDLPYEFETLLWGMFGESKHHSTGIYSEAEWRRLMRKVLHELGRYTRLNVISDRAHHEQVVGLLEQMLNDVQRRDFEIFTICNLTKLCLLLLGGYPAHADKRAVNRPEHFLLNKYRTVQYCQSPEQKARLIYERYIRPREKEEEKTGNYHGEANKWHRLLAERAKRFRYTEFVAEFREAFPKDYLRIFG